MYLNSIKYFTYNTIAVNPHDTSQSAYYLWCLSMHTNFRLFFII